MLCRVTLQTDIEAADEAEAANLALQRIDSDLSNVAIKAERISALGTGVQVPDYVEIRDDHDARPEQEGVVVLEMIAYSIVGDNRVEVIDSLCDIDFFEDSDTYVRGVFDRVTDIPAVCEHLREIARDMRLPE